ncbi:hypothetical protein DICA3_D10638 [Diutina catenulata]
MTPKATDSTGKAYQSKEFREAISSMTDMDLADDSSDLLIYTIYQRYIQLLLERSVQRDGSIAQDQLDKTHEQLMKQFRG